MAKANVASPVDASAAAGSEVDLAGGAVGMIDLSGVPDEVAFPVIPRGIYPAIVSDLTYGLSQSSGNPMWTWIFEISEGEFVGRKLFFHSPFVESMMPRVKKLLSRIAPEFLQGPFNPETVANEGTMLGKSCRIRVDIKPYEGVARNNVRDVLPPDASDEGAFLSGSE